MHIQDENKFNNLYRNVGLSLNSMYYGVLKSIRPKHTMHYLYLAMTYFLLTRFGMVV